MIPGVNLRSPIHRSGFYLLLVLLVLLPWGHGQKNDTDTTKIELRSKWLQPKCNESFYLNLLDTCITEFQTWMDRIDKRRWCNLNVVLRDYNGYSKCTQTWSEYCSWFWPNELVQESFIYLHKTFFINCTTESTEFVDRTPPNALMAMVLLPICLIPVMLAPMLWWSNRD
ncbi:receptor activity-modifying protein 3-like [Protopterus annectens]|uniref:receptor activity-modifying protein 3-like n=1 Tax=Protopterus annectens TaxID=7888 RepID=UPI001CF97E67|nr:receptor activity-modifying protein 3-like [Protopterus annectens]